MTTSLVVSTRLCSVGSSKKVNPRWLRGSLEASNSSGVVRLVRLVEHAVVNRVYKTRRAGKPAQLDVVAVLGLAHDGLQVVLVDDRADLGGIERVTQPGGHEYLTLPELAHQVAIRDVHAFAEQPVAVGHLLVSWQRIALLGDVPLDEQDFGVVAVFKRVRVEHAQCLFEIGAAAQVSGELLVDHVGREGFGDQFFHGRLVRLRVSHDELQILSLRLFHSLFYNIYFLMSSVHYSAANLLEPVEYIGAYFLPQPARFRCPADIF